MACAKNNAPHMRGHLLTVKACILANVLDALLLQVGERGSRYAALPLDDFHDEERCDGDEISLHIKELRVAKHLSQEAIANSIDMSRSYFAEIETDSRNVSMINLEKTVEGLGTSLQHFFDGAFLIGER